MDEQRLEAMGANLARNLKEIRKLRGLTQGQLAKLCELPRSTIANVETGGSNPTLAVLAGLASALRLSFEELLAPSRARCQLYPPGSLPESEYRRWGKVSIGRLLPHPIPGMAIDRMVLEPGARHTGSPHAPGTHEYLYCDRGRLTLRFGGETFELEQGSVAAFEGDQRHSYQNLSRGVAVGFSVVSLTPISKLGVLLSK